MLGKIHFEEITMGAAPVVAGSRIVEGAVAVLLPSFHGLPRVQVSAEPEIPRASMTKE